MPNKNILLGALVLVTAVGGYFYWQLSQTKDYIKSLPAPHGTTDGLPPHQ